MNVNALGIISKLTNPKMLLAAAIGTGAVVACKCIQKNVDKESCHDVFIRCSNNALSETTENNLKIQDGISFEVNSKIYLMQNGQLMVYDKENKAWEEVKGNKINKILYQYQTDVLMKTANAVNESDGEVILSKNDIKRIKLNPLSLGKSDNSLAHQNVKSEYNNRVRIDAGIYCHELKHETKNFVISYDVNKDNVILNDEEKVELNIES